MSKKYKIIFAAVTIFALLAYGAWGMPKEKKELPDKKENETKINARVLNEDAVKKLTLLKQSRIDVDGDQEEEKIELYTAAQRDVSGEIAWDDGQNWRLIVRDGQKEYPLFDGRIQLGQLDYQVYAANDNKMYIVTTYTDAASMKLSELRFDKEKQCFIQKVLYDPTNINPLTAFEPY